MFVESSRPRVQGDNAMLMSQLIPNSSPMCFTYWYNMHGSSVGALNIRMLIKGGEVQNLTSITGDQGTGWKQGKTNIGNSYADFNVSFF